MNVVTTESAAFVLDATVVVIPIYPRGGRVRWLRFSATMYVFCGSCHPLHCSCTMWCKESNTLKGVCREGGGGGGSPDRFNNFLNSVLHGEPTSVAAGAFAVAAGHVREGYTNGHSSHLSPCCLLCLQQLLF